MKETLSKHCPNIVQLQGTAADGILIGKNQPTVRVHQRQLSGESANPKRKANGKKQERLMIDTEGNGCQMMAGVWVAFSRLSRPFLL